MGSQVTCVMGFIPANIQLSVSFRSRLMVRHRTDRQTDRETTAINVAERKKDRKSNFSHFRVFNAPAKGVCLEFCNGSWLIKTRIKNQNDAPTRQWKSLTFFLVQHHSVTEGRTDKIEMVNQYRARSARCACSRAIKSEVFT